MNRIAAILIVLLTSACSAQQSTVGKATAIYKSCLQGFHQAYGWPRTREAVIKQVENIDTTCLAWTATWLVPFLDPERPFMTDAEIDRFRVQTDRIIFAYQNELLLSLPRR